MPDQLWALLSFLQNVQLTSKSKPNRSLIIYLNVHRVRICTLQNVRYRTQYKNKAKPCYKNLQTSCYTVQTAHVKDYYLIPFITNYNRFQGFNDTGETVSAMSMTPLKPPWSWNLKYHRDFNHKKFFCRISAVSLTPLKPKNDFASP
jgi:hypothetical protein